MFRKLGKLSVAIAVLQKANSVKALTTKLPSFVYTQSTQEQANLFNFEISLSWDHGIFFFTFLNSLLLTILIIKLMKFRKTPQLMLEVTSLHSCVFIPLMNLPLCPSHSHITIPESMATISISGSWIFPKLNLDWAHSFVNDDCSINPQHFPSSISITFWQSLHLAKILKHPYFINLHMEHHGYLSPMYISPM